jgi:glucokinase
VTSDGPVLIGDIGGTNARFAILPRPGAPLLMLPRALTASFPTPVDAIRDALSGSDAPAPRTAMLAIAARVESPVVGMTNAHWTIDAAGIAADLALGSVTLVNDFVPIAAALEALREANGDLARIGPDLAGGHGPMLVLGPGTGLGAAALAPVGDRVAVLPTEAGHVEFGPAHADEAAVWPGLERVHERVTTEAVLSGPGLERLHRALAFVTGETSGLETASDICAAALSGGDRQAAATLDLFGRLLGRFAGDLALIFGATGGVYLAGGIAPRLIDVLRSGAFRSAFERKAPQDAFLRKIPTFVVTHPDPALEGLAILASRPDHVIYPRVSVP